MEHILEGNFERMDPQVVQMERWRAHEDTRRRRRKVARSFKLRLHQLWHLPSTALQTSAANWLFGRFPADRGTVRWLLGARRYDGADAELRALFLQERWSASDARKVVDTLELFAEHLPLPLRLTRERAEGVNGRSR